MKNSKITKFIVDTADYFAAHTDNNGIRFGLVGEVCYQISADHKAAAAILACTTSDEVEAIFDDFESGVYGKFVYNIAA